MMSGRTDNSAVPPEQAKLPFGVSRLRAIDWRIQPAARAGMLVLLWLGSAVAYYALLLRPYGLLDHYTTPGLSLGAIARREPRAAAGFVLFILITFLLHAMACRICWNWRSGVGAGACILAGTLTTAILAMVYPIGATDVFDYIVQGELLALRGLNPMVYPATAAPDVPFIPWAPYSYAVSPYGPLWTWLEAAVVRMASRGGLLFLLLSFKALAIVGYLAACGLIVFILRRRAPQAMTAGLVAFAWNPLVLTEVATNAHNDAWLGVLVLAGVLFWELKRPLPMLAVLTLALLIKVPIAPLLLVFALAAWRREPPGRRTGLAVRGALLMATLVAASYLPLPQGWRGIGNLLQRNEFFTHSLPAVCKLVLERVVPQGTAVLLVGTATTLVFAAYALAQLRNVWRQPAEVVRLGFNTLLFLLLGCMPWFQPWYLLWIMPLAAVYPRPDALFQASLSTFSVLFSYVVFGFLWFWWPPLRGQYLGVNLIVLATSYGLPWAYVAWSGWKARKPHVRRNSAIASIVCYLTGPSCRSPPRRTAPPLPPRRPASPPERTACCSLPRSRVLTHQGGGNVSQVCPVCCCSHVAARRAGLRVGGPRAARTTTGRAGAGSADFGARRG